MPELLSSQMTACAGFSVGIFPTNVSKVKKSLDESFENMWLLVDALICEPLIEAVDLIGGRQKYK
jgi:hypothetical protein